MFRETRSSGIFWLLVGALLVAASDAQATVTVNKNCYRKGETIQVNFQNIVGEYVWIGVVSHGELQNSQQGGSTTVGLTPNSANQGKNQLMDFVFTCGDKVTCTTWPSSGTLSFTTDELPPEQDYIVIVSDTTNPNVMAQARSAVFRIDFTCIELPAAQDLVDWNAWSAPRPTDQRGPCPFINTLANHGIVHRNGTFIDLFDMANRLEAVYNVAGEFLHHGPVQLAIDCNQTYTDENGIIRLDLEDLFDERCEEHEASMVRADSFYGFEESKLVDDALLNNLMRRNPTGTVLRRRDIMDFQSDRIMDSRLINPETKFRPFDIQNMGAQGIFFFLLGTDPTLETVEKARLYSFLLLEKLPDDFVPGALRESTPFNFLDPTDFTNTRFVESMNHVEIMMNISVFPDNIPMAHVHRSSH